jgi:integrase
MYNPSYLVKSRHDIFYFRYPLPVKASRRESRISISLKTRCPKEALLLAKSLEYHSDVLLTKASLLHMDHHEIRVMMKRHYSQVLEQRKAEIFRDGPLPNTEAMKLQTQLRKWDEVIELGADDVKEGEGFENDNMKESLLKIRDEKGFPFAPDSQEYKTMESYYKHMMRAFTEDLIQHNNEISQFNFKQWKNNHNPSSNYKSGHTLGGLLATYMDEIKQGLSSRSHNEQRDCLYYLIDWLGENYPIIKIDDAKAREAKENLIYTPTGRNKGKLTKGLPLTEQIAIAKEHKLPVLSNISVNKYLGYFKSLFDWAKNNRYISENPFEGIRVKASKKKNRREMFSKEEVKQIIENLGDGTPNKLVKNSTYYWGALIAVYTGARRNEIASLLPDDIKQDAATGIWYFDITDEEEEGKALKTKAAKRIVPIHSRLIELGFLDFVKEASGMKGKIKHKNGYEPRLLYKLTYTDHDKWGRNLGRWFNEHYLKTLGLKAKKKVMHSLRHSLITYLSIAGVEGANIKSIVGHEPDTVTTQIYTHYGIEHLPAFREALEKLPY